MKLHYFEALGSVLIVGLGQIIKGKTEKGLALLLTFYVGLPAIIYVSLLINGNFIIYSLSSVVIAGIVLWLYSLTDTLFNK